MQASELNLIRFASTFGQFDGGDYFDNRKVRWAYTGSPDLNRVFDLRVDHEEIENTIEEVMEWFNKRLASFIWFVGPSTTPPDAGRYLLDKGLELKNNWAGMELYLENLKEEILYNNNVEIREAQTENEIRQYVNVFNSSFQMNLDTDNAQRIVKRQKETNKETLFYYIAKYNDIPAASTGVYGVYIDEHNIAGLYFVATLPEYRGKGIAKYLVTQVLRQVKDKGCTRSILHASEMGEPMYKKLGFNKLCEYQVYSWNIDKGIFDKTWTNCKLILANNQTTIL